jgi:hypothetical protein
MPSCIMFPRRRGITRAFKIFGTENIEGYKYGLSGTDRMPAWSQNAHGLAEVGIDTYDGLTRFGGSADDLAGGVWWHW